MKNINVLFIAFVFSLFFISSCKFKANVEVSQSDKNESEAMAMDTSKYKFLKENSLGKDYLQENFWKLTYDSAGNDLKYYVIVPKDVRPISITPKKVANSDLVEIGTYARVESTKPYMEINVYTEHFKQDPQPADWVKSTMKKMGYNIINHFDIVSEQGNKYIDILAEQSDNVVRVTEYTNGKGDFVMLAVFCSKEDYNQLSDEIQFITSNWKLP